MYKHYKHIHMVGIGGIGMSGIAELLLNMGYTVTGSDLRLSPVTDRLTSLGGVVFQGHRAENVAGANVVVISSAIGPANPEVMAARLNRIPVIPRAEMLAELMRLKYGIAVAGAHGKTTTSTMVGSVLYHGDMDPTQIIGGRLSALGSSNARLGQGEFLVAEADESDGSFLKLTPTVAVVTNIDAEHLDYYRDLDHIRDTFLDFLNKVPFYGLDVICLDDPNLQSLIPYLEKRYLTYGFNTQAHLQAVNVEHGRGGVVFDVLHHGSKLGRIELPIPGEHNALNALAAIGVGLELEIPFEKICQGLASMGRIERRFQHRGERGGVTVMDDYAHHPTEINAVLDALNKYWPDKRLVVVFQPHRHTRTDALASEFATAFYGADRVIVMPIYAAGEVPGRLTASDLAQEIRLHGHADVLDATDADQALAIATESVSKGDLLVTLGAGDVWKVGQEFVAAGGEDD